MATKKSEDKVDSKQNKKQEDLKALHDMLSSAILGGQSSRFQVIDEEVFKDKGLDIALLEDGDFQILMDKLGINSFSVFPNGGAVSFKLNPDVVKANRSGRIKQDNGHPFFKPNFYEQLKTCLAANDHVFLVGPTGCGKTTMAKVVAEELGRQFYRMNCNGETTIDNFIGSVRLTNKETVFEPGILPKAMEEGAVLLLDEVDAAQPEVLFLLHSVLEKNASIVLHDDGSRVVKAAPGFAVIAAANTLGTGDETGNYSGTNILNAAFLDRFAACWPMEYSDKEKEILKHYSDDEALINKMLAFAKNMRTAYDDNEIMTTMSTRKLIELVRKAPVFGIYKAFEAVILNRVPNDDKDKVKQFAVNNNLTTKSVNKSEL